MASIEFAVDGKAVTVDVAFRKLKAAR